MRWALRATLVATILTFTPGLFEGWETPKAAVARIAGWGLLAAVLATRGWRARLRLQPLDLAVAGMLAVELLATAFSVAPRVSLVGDPQQHEGLMTSVALAGLYLAARLALPRPGDARGTLDAWVIAACGASAYAFLQAAGLDPAPWKNTAVLGAVVRPFGTLGHPNLLGVITSAAGAIAIVRAATPGRARRWFAGAALILALATVLTFSRAAWLGLAAGVVAALARVAAARGSARVPARAAWIAAGVLAALGAGLMLSPLGGTLASRMRDLLTPLGGSGASRLDIWRAAWAAWRERPILGQGPDAFELAFARFEPADYHRLEWNHLAAHAHSIYLHALATRGALGALAGAAGIAALVTAARAAWRVAEGARDVVAALAGACVAMAVAGFTGALGIAGATALTLAAALFANLAAPSRAADPAAPRPGPEPARASRRERRPARRAAPRPRAPLAMAPLVAGIGAAAALLVFSAFDLGALQEAGAARRWIEKVGPPADEGAQLRFAALAGRLRAATNRAPWCDTAPRTLGELLLIAAPVAPDPVHVFALAEDAEREAVHRVPERSANHRRLAGALAEQVVRGVASKVAECEAEFARAAALSPYDAFVLVEWARTRLARHLPGAALEIARQAATKFPERGMAIEPLGEAQLASGDTTAARATFTRALAATWEEEFGARDRAQRLLAAIGPAR